jgi:hypothetical protein
VNSDFPLRIKGLSIAKRPETRFLVGDRRERVQEVTRQPRQAIEPGHKEDVAGVELHPSFIGVTSSDYFQSSLDVGGRWIVSIMGFGAVADECAERLKDRSAILIRVIHHGLERVNSANPGHQPFLVPEILKSLRYLLADKQIMGCLLLQQELNVSESSTN